MNPIFARRNRSSAPPPASTSSGGQQSGRGGGAAAGSASSSRADVVEPLSPPHSPTKIKGRPSSGHSRPSSKHRKSVTANANLAHHHPRHVAGKQAKEAEQHMILAQNFLASKQNLLAQASLTPEENFARQTRSKSSPDNVMSDTESAEGDCAAFQMTSKKDKRHSVPQTASATMQMCDIEDEDFDFGDTVTRSHSPGAGRHYQCDNYSHLSVPGSKNDTSCSISTIDVKTWRELKAVVVGPTGSLHDGWYNQGFTFDSHVPYGLVQKRGGPCGVLAVVEALLLKNLMFGSPYADDGDDDLPFPEPIVSISSDPNLQRLFGFRRTKALVLALTEILWRCGNMGNKSYFHFDPLSSRSNAWSDNPEECKEETGAKLCFTPNTVGSEVRQFIKVDQLRNFIHTNLAKIDCTNLVYSAVLSRGIQAVQDDFDFPNCPLLGTHGYCSQELVNLLAIGKAISNVFDNQIALDDKILKGIESRSDIGFLSLFEHYDSCQVGTHLKSPKFPIWIVCSESHFSVLFSMEPELSQDTSSSIQNFDLYYYDGLARQQNHIKLSIELCVGKPGKQHQPSRSGASLYFSSNNNNNESDADEELIPPLEKCIRTKWKTAHIDWNDTEPIL